jgi:hypothetical protein
MAHRLGFELCIEQPFSKFAFGLEFVSLLDFKLTQILLSIIHDIQKMHINQILSKPTLILI